MTDTGVIDLPLPDATARARISEELDTNLLVEAGAGSGKTTALVDRMVALIATGTATVDQIAAVTFTRKAAGELRERFQTGVERQLGAERMSAGDALVVERLTRALDDIDRSFIGTIHSFCGRLLRERPLDIGLDPGFEELPVEERAILRRRFWESYLERLARDSSPLLEDLARAGLRPATLYRLFDSLVENPDVRFVADDTDPPSVSDVGAIRAALDEIVDRGWELMDDMPPPRGWDSLQKKIRQLHFERDITGWTEPVDLFEAVSLLCKAGTRGHTTTLKRWRDKEMARSLKERVNTFGVGDTPAQRLVDRWYAHRYALAIRLGRQAAKEFEAHRHRIGKLDFQDLLVLAARLLRENPEVRTHLGSRYRYVLVDEFQDTDPLQAEIMLLLSSEPLANETGEEGADMRAPGDWRTAVPRAGALFVVGDPKQSIYRFRRADIQLYGFVKERFEEFGEVVVLSTNFRSRPPIGDLVNDLFARPDYFPAESTPEQAAFERLDTRPPVEAVPRDGVFTYEVAPEQSRKDAAAFDDAERLSTWIRARVDAGERKAADFMILTWDRGQIAAYARALEARSLPVQVTGAGVGVEEEIRELQVLLACMIDPTNSVKVVSALVGLFFGIDYERLVAHRLEGGGLDAMRPGDRGHPEVVGALRQLHSWWRISIAEPADVFIGRLVSELGLLPYAASGDLGSLRAGALLYALDAVRTVTLAGEASLPGALSALESALELREAEAPLEPLRTDAVQLMNLHQAKGLEATVVVLANPTATQPRRPDLHLSRTVTGAAEGFLRITQPGFGHKGGPDLARPLGWLEKEKAEQRFDDAEEVRLLYVAVTRAREELVVARWPDGRGPSVWAALDPWLEAHAESLDLESLPPSAREELADGAEAVGEQVHAASAKIESMREPTYRHTTVTELTKRAGSADLSDEGAEPRPGETGFRGFAWGSAVHGALAVASATSDDEALRAACRDLLVEHQRPQDDHGEPVELRELLELVRVVQGSELWSRAQAADRSLAEVSFSIAGLPPESEAVPTEVETWKSSEKEKKQLDLFAEAVSEPADALPLEDAPTDDDSVLGEHVVLEGVVDLAFHEPDGWVIADYKTDLGTDPAFSSRAAGYRRQVDLYADAWSRLTGEPVKERVLFYTAQGRIESW